MDLSFGETLLIIGLLLATAAALSGVMRGTVLSTSVLSVGLGIILAQAGALSVDPHSESVRDLIELALILTLFSDGMLVERELLREHWSPVTRAIVLAMPITLALLAVAAKLLFGVLSWPEALLLAAVLSPTDPVVTSSVVSSKRVPKIVRHILNVESGLNDGLAVPFVLFFLIFASPTGNAEHGALTLLGETVAGGVIGVLIGMIGGRLHQRLPGGGITARYEGIYAIGFGLAAFGLADVTIGNGFIATFVAGITMAIAEHDVPDAFVEFSENVSAISQVLTFFVFGALIVGTGYDRSILPLVAFIAFALLVARTLAVETSFVRSGLPRPQKAFIAWFGPKGVASMLFALLVLKSTGVDNNALIFDIAAFTILASIVAHGLTDTIGAKWVERRMGAAEQDP